ncbi:permease [Micromonospora sp. ATCC 39149]|uniref:Permease n=1 Tax=Micromonospora carbonacea TaxID=47853 RepID=A0A7D5Y5K3_9ACTN|nr:permease [Micromonospora sp. ATCC 39149]QLJ97492.1 permease [Micromonospora carbonacea]
MDVPPGATPGTGAAGGATPDVPEGKAAPGGPRRSVGGWFGSVEVLAALLVLLIVFREQLAAALAGPRLQTWTTVFVSVLVQAVPFLVFGVLLSAVIAVFVPRSFWARALPRHPALAVPVASAAGVVLPGCECGAVPIAGSLIRRGVTPAAALAFLLAAPAVNPIVLAATAVAFPGAPEMVLARALASLVVAMIMGWLWLRLGRADWIRLPHRPELEGTSRGAAFWAAMRHDIIHAGGFLVVGAMAAASINVLVPERWLQTLADSPVLSVLALAVLAVLLSLCSEADAFVAASLSQFSLTSRLVFLVVGPMVDLKLISMQAGIFGRRFAFRFAPATFVVAVGVASLAGTVLL